MFHRLYAENNVTEVSPSNIAPFGLKFWENAFQTIPDISSFDVEKKFRQKNLKKLGVECSNPKSGVQRPVGLHGFPA